MQRKLYLLLLVFIFSISAFAQKMVNICGEYTYYAPKNVTLEQAMQTALERAKVEALAEKFGTLVTINNATVVKNENEKSDIRFLSLGGSEMKGEWIEDTKTPIYDVSYEQDMLIVKVSVCGKARKITGAGIDFSAKILRNGTESKYESDYFKHGDNLYILFKSPVDGYLAVYFIDDAPTAFCLLPYMKDTSGKTKIRGGKEYVFFSQQHADRENVALIDEYTLTCEKSVEQNFIYIIFSPNEFTKANDNEATETGEIVLPRELSYEEFQKWLVKNRNRDKDMKVEIKSITIKK
ncbi:MAG: DUF4384 domain-containing protein [Prevotellaceae bacterium]|jgi:hypothetical protein|nr:DUF4384 domain-containing protein [Prevotellaceae bacterium]